MKTMLCMWLICSCGSALSAQTIIGNWQLAKQSNCLEESLTTSDSTQYLVDNMKSISSATPQIVAFKEKQAGVETTRILNRRKGANSKNFLYRFDGELLMILDKKSRTITATYIVDKFSADSLIVSNASRPCEIKIFLRIK